jgi:hypothetical protein
MKDGFDEWAESTRPAQFGGLDKEAAPPTMPGTGGAMTLYHAKKMNKMMGRSRMAGGVIPIPDNIKNFVAQVREIRVFLSDMLTWVDDLEFDLKENVIPNPRAPPAAKVIAQQLIDFLTMFKGARATLQTVLDLAASYGLGKPGMRGGFVVPEWLKNALKYAVQVANFFAWLKMNKAAIYFLLEMRTLQPYGKMALDAIKPIADKLLGSSRRKLTCGCKQMSCPGKCMCGSGKKKMIVTMPDMSDYEAATLGAGRRRRGGAKSLSLIPEYTGMMEGSAAPSEMSYKYSDVRPVGMARSCGGAKRSNPRGEIVKRVMREHGLSLPQASKYVKEHGLY